MSVVESIMLSPAVAESLSQWESPHQYCHRYQGSTDGAPQLKLEAEDGKDMERMPVHKVYTRRRGPSVEKEEVGSSGDDDRVVVSTKVCADCGTSKTPLWRNGPAGPKSLCNACGIRFRKRGKTGFGVVQVGNAVFLKGKPRQDRNLFLLQSKLAGTEEARAAEMLMALSCDFSVRFSRSRFLP